MANRKFTMVFTSIDTEIARIPMASDTSGLIPRERETIAMVGRDGIRRKFTVWGVEWDFQNQQVTIEVGVGK